MDGCIDPDLFNFQSLTLENLTWNRSRPCLCICGSFASIKRFLGTIEVITNQTWHGNCLKHGNTSRVNYILILTFFQGHTDRNHDNNKCLILS